MSEMIVTHSNGVVERYGDKAKFLQMWKPSISVYCHNNLQKSIGTPTLNAVRNAYGEDVAITFISKLIADFLIFRGEENSMDEMDIIMCASLLIGNRELCSLNLAFFMNFFFEMKCGKYKIFGSVNAGKIMECFQEYFKWAYDKQNACYDEDRKQKEKEEYDNLIKQVKSDRENGLIPNIDYSKLFIDINKL